jgi:hypothetical protein
MSCTRDEHSTLAPSEEQVVVRFFFKFGFLSVLSTAKSFSSVTHFLSVYELKSKKIKNKISVLFL